MASKKIKRVKNPITTEPSGISFMYQEYDRPLTVPHDWHTKPEHHCPNGGKVYDAGPNKSPGVNRPDARIFKCDGCKWKSPSGNFEHNPTTKTPHRVETRVRKGNGPVDDVRIRNKVRKEVRRRMNILEIERAKFPPSLLKKGKRWVGNPKFTNEMRDHMHRFYVSSEEIRDAIKAGKKLPAYPA